MSFRMVLLTAAAAVGMSCAAEAMPIAANSSINLNGYVQATGATTLNMATSLDFTAGNGATLGVAGVLSSYNQGTGTFAGVSCGGSNCGSIQDIGTLAIGAQTITNFVSMTGGTNASPINFTLTSIDSINRNMGGDPRFLSFVASGFINYDGFDQTAATFLFSAQGNTVTSFSGTTLATATTVPAPASIAILGASLCLLGLVRRKKA